MNCDLCGEALLPSQPLIKEQYGEIVNGEFVPTEEPSIHHDLCGED